MSADSCTILIASWFKSGRVHVRFRCCERLFISRRNLTYTILLGSHLFCQRSVPNCTRFRRPKSVLLSISHRGRALASSLRWSVSLNSQDDFVTSVRTDFLFHFPKYHPMVRMRQFHARARELDCFTVLSTVCEILAVTHDRSAPYKTIPAASVTPLGTKPRISTQGGSDS